MKDKEEFSYQEEGVVTQTIGATISLFVGLGVIILVVVLVGILGGKAYNTVQADLIILHADGNQNALTQDVNSAVVSAFSGYADSVAFLGIIVLAIVFFLVLALLATGMRPFSGGGAGAI